MLIIVIIVTIMACVMSSMFVVSRLCHVSVESVGVRRCRVLPHVAWRRCMMDLVCRRVYYTVTILQFDFSNSMKLVVVITVVISSKFSLIQRILTI